MGNDVTIALAAEAGQLELNAFEPVIFYKLFESMECITNAMKTLTENCVKGIVANAENCEDLLMQSVGTVTAICPYIGYKKAAEIAKEALNTNTPIKELILKKGVMNESLLNEALDPLKMTEPEK